MTQPVLPSPGVDHVPSTTLESSVVLLLQEAVDADTSRVTYAAPRDSMEQGVHLSQEDDTAKPVISVVILPKDTNFITKIRTRLIEADDDNAINFNANTIFPDRVYLKRWKDTDKVDARHINVKEKLESVERYSIDVSAGNIAVKLPMNDVQPRT